jgi:hypothetical protein
MGVRIMRVSNDLLANLLCLPPGTQVMGVCDRDPHSFATGTFAVEVSHPDLPPVPEGSPIPDVNPCYTHDKNDRPVFLEWGLRTADIHYTVADIRAAADTPTVVTTPVS